MSTPLWTLADVVAATGAKVDDCSLSRNGAIAPTPHSGDTPDPPSFSSKKAGGPEGVPPAGARGLAPVHAEHGINGISIDTRTLEPGDLFVALQDVRDGHDFVTAAFAKGASVALVKTDYIRKEGDGCLLRVANPLEALENLGRAARARLSPAARVIAVTGSAGKTTTKEMLRACLSAVAPGQTHASEKSYNNHWGVPLTLARMPADTKYAVFEIGMNHAGEIKLLSPMVRPHVAIVTTVEAVHLEHFASVEDIARAKAEIFEGLEPGGTAIIPADNPHAGLLKNVLPKNSGCRSFALEGHADYELSASVSGIGTDVIAKRSDSLIKYALGMRGGHNISNSLAVLATLEAVGLDGTSALEPLAKFTAPPGRGSLVTFTINGVTSLVIDESYNANPASMRAALSVVDLIPRASLPRRVAVLGDMLELGPDAPRLHAELASAIESAGVDLVFACGTNMRHLYNALPAAKRGTWAETSAGLEASLLAEVRGGDVVMIKGSNGSKMALLVSALKQRFGHIPAKTGI